MYNDSFNNVVSCTIRQNEYKSVRETHSIIWTKEGPLFIERIYHDFEDLSSNRERN
jgi:hypothetical protein